MLVGRRLCDEKYEGGPACELSCPSDPKTLVGLDEIACECDCEKLRAEDVTRAAASGDALTFAIERGFLIRLEPVEAISLVRDAIVCE